jgi:hypothetical protein
MAQDPLSRVASWLTPASADVTDESLITSPPEDPVIALIAEEKRLEVLWTAADGKGHDRQAKVLDEQMGAILNQLRNRNIKPITLAGAIAMLEEGHHGGCIDDGLISAAIASLRDMRPEASRISPGGDDRILSLFREWVDGRRNASAIEDEDEAEKILGPADEAEDTIVSIPATGVAGLAVKAYFYLWFEDGWYAADCAALSGRAADETDDKPRVQLKLGLLKDIVAFAPELAPLADRYIKGLPREVWARNGAADRDRKVIGFGEPEEASAA